MEAALIKRAPTWSLPISWDMAWHTMIANISCNKPYLLNFEIWEGNGIRNFLPKISVLYE